MAKIINAVQPLLVVKYSLDHIYLPTLHKFEFSGKEPVCLHYCIGFEIFCLIVCGVAHTSMCDRSTQIINSRNSCSQLYRQPLLKMQKDGQC